MAKATSAKTKLAVTLVALLIALIAIGGTALWRGAAHAKDGTVVTVGVVGNSDDDIWKAVQAELDSRQSGITVRLRPFQDGIYANQALDNHELDLTAFQGHAFFDQEVKEHGYHATVIADTFIRPLNVYSRNIASVDELKAGDKVAIPNNTTNAGRALQVLESAGLLTLRDGVDNPTVDDVTANPKGIVIDQVAPENIINLLPDYAAGITNTNFVIDAGLDPKSAIYQVPLDLTSKYNKPWINTITANTDQKDNPAYAKVVQAFQTKRVADAINTVYKGSAIIAFKY